MPPDQPALNRHAEQRSDPGLLHALLADPQTRVVVWCDGQVAVSDGPAGYRTATLAPGELPVSLDAADSLVFLGRGLTGTAYLGLLVAAAARDEVRTGLRTAQWAGLREVGPQLSAHDLELVMTAQALGRWHQTHRFCPRCGQQTQSRHGGWMRRCAADGSEHYPRTDPAVIMSVVDAEDRLLLARAAVWPEDRWSVLAGFVEPGERLEAAVAREVQEEVGLRVTDIRYLGSQPWPFPASIMVGYGARVVGESRLIPNPTEIADARWYRRDSLAADVASGTVVIPGRLSIARRLIEGWYGGVLVPPVESVFRLR